MKAPLMPSQETDRQAALDQTGLLDTPSEERFDRFTRIARSAFNTPIALVTLVDQDRQWFKSIQGLDISETPRQLSFCGHAIHQPDIFVVEDALSDERFKDNPLVTGEPRVRFYAGAPLHDRDGFRLGTLCIIDREPRIFDDRSRALLRDLADGVEQEIKHQAANDYHRALRKSERRTRAIIEGTRTGTWEWNVQTGETVFNDRWAEICGYKLEELAPVSIKTWLGLAHPDDLQESDRLLNEHFQGKRSEYDFRCRMKHKDGGWVWVHDRGQVLEWTEAGEPLMMFGTHTDISEEMQNLESIQQQNSAFRILNKLAIEPETETDARIQNALRLACDYLKLEIGIISEITSQVWSVRWCVVPASADLTPETNFSLEDTYCSILLQESDSGESLAIGHMAESAFADHDCYRKFGLESYIAAPIYVQDDLFGTLSFSSADPREQGFSETETTFITLLARWVGGLLEREHNIEMLTKLVDHTPGMLYQYQRWENGHSAFTFSSPHIRDIYGVESHEVEKDATVVFSRIHPDDLQPVADSIDHSADTLTIWEKQYRVTDGQSGWRWVEGRASPEKLPDRSVIWHGYIADIDETKRTEVALQESEAQLRGLYELAPIGIALSDYRTGDFLDINEALLKQTGFSRDELLAGRVQRLFPAEIMALQKSIARELSSEGRYGPYEVAIPKANGSSYPAIIRGLLISDGDERPLVWTLVEDITERKKVDRMKNEFISTVSHELRTPLTSISGSLGLINGGALGEVPEKMTKMLSIAQKNSEHLRQLVDDLLDMEKLVSGTMTMNRTLQPALPMVQEVVERLHTYAVRQSVSVVIADGDDDAVVMADASRLQQALANLLSNAIKFSPDGGTVTVELHSKGDRLVISVADQGPGVPESFQPNIFQKFAQADSSSTRSKGGTGLGLAITKEIMNQMDGSVGFESVEGQGATFWLELAIAESRQHNP